MADDNRTYYQSFMVTFRAAIALSALITLSACANPSVDTSEANFDETQYAVDLDLCRGGTAVEAMLSGVGGAIVGSALGAADGAFYGAIAGDAPEGVVIGAIVGTAIGFTVGIYKPIEIQEQNVRRCLTQKGYALTS